MRISICLIQFLFLVTWVTQENEAKSLKKHKHYKLINRRGCGKGGTVIHSHKIVGGKKAKIGEFPWVVNLAIKNNFGEFLTLCTGTIISHRWVITAGHCHLPHEIEVLVVGMTKKNEKKGKHWKIYYPQKFIRHPKYKEYEGATELVHDLTLIRTTKSIKYNENIKPICLPVTSTKEQFLKKKYFVAAGFGAVDPKGKRRSNSLLVVKLPPYPMKKCKKIWSHARVPDTICAGGKKGKDSCNGDSGGPLMTVKKKRYTLIGAVSYGPSRCGSKGIPAVYASIPAHMKWILNKIY